MARRERATVRSSGGVRVLGIGENASPAAEQADRLFARRTGFVTGLRGRATDRLIHRFFGRIGRPRGPAYPRISWVPALPLWPAFPWTSEPAARGIVGGRLCRDLARLGLQTCLMKHCARRDRGRRTGIVGLGSPIGAFCGSGAGAEASTTGAWNSTLCSGWASRASSKLPLRNWSAAGADSASTLRSSARAATAGRACRSRSAGRACRAGQARSWSRRPRARRAPKRRGARRDSSRAPLRRSLRP